MAMRVVSGGGNVHRGALLLSSPTAIHGIHRRSILPIKRSSFFVPENFSPFSLSNPKAKMRIGALECCSRGHRNGIEVEVEDEFGSSSEVEDFLVVSFYKFVCIKDPEAEVSKHLAFLQGRDIHGRIYVNEQGINAQYSGPTKDALAYAEWLKDVHRFSDILVQTSPAFSGHAFPRLKLRYKPSLVQFEGGTLHLPLSDPSMRATPLSSSEWRKRLEVVNDADMQSEREDSALNRKYLILDVRNGYEWDIGHFQGAHRPNVDSFRGTSFGISDQQDQVTNSDPLAGLDKEHTDILMYCTGGIRCDVYSTVLRQRGFQNLYTLSGGVSNYLQSEGSAKWVGNLFVFDSRLSLLPSTYKSGGSDGERHETGPCQIETRNEMIYQNGTFARCYICSSEILEFRHRNCANIDCNRLFLCCVACVKELRGCCCLECMRAPRLRPVIPGSQRYQKWHLYRDGVFQQQS